MGSTHYQKRNTLKTSSEFVLNSFDVYWGIRLGEAGVVAQISTVAGRRSPVGPHPLVYEYDRWAVSSIGRATDS